MPVGSISRRVARLEAYERRAFQVWLENLPLKQSQVWLLDTARQLAARGLCPYLPETLYELPQAEKDSYRAQLEALKGQPNAECERVIRACWRAAEGRGYDGA